MLEKYVCAWTRRLLGGQSARSLDDKVRLALEPSASTCVCGCRVCMICAFCISAAVLRAVFSCIVTVYALWCSQKIESDSRDSACEPAPSPLLRSSLTHAHRCIGPRNPSRPTPTSARLMCLGVSDSRDSIYTFITPTLASRSLSLAHDLPTFPCCT